MMPMIKHRFAVIAFGLFLVISSAALAQNASGQTAPPQVANTEESINPSGQSNDAPSAAESETDLADSEKSEELISVNFEQVDVRDVVRILADKAQLNMVVGPEVAATVNLQLNNVTWQKALDVILITYNLTYKWDGDMIRIMTLDQMQAENEKVPLTTKILTLNFARASEIKSNFSNMLSGRGKIDVNDRTNSLIITDIPDAIVQIEEIANKLDTRTPQVMIEALMADVVITQDDQLGINWDVARPDTIEGAGASQAGRIPKQTFEQNFGSLAAPGGIIKFGTTLLTNTDLHATIVAWQQQSRVNILAHPQVITLDNLAAKINLTEEIPYQQQTQSTQSTGAVVSTSFKEAGISLAVTPHITTKDNYIYLNIDVKQSFRSGFTPDNQPIVDSRSASTNLLVRDKETAIIGGLRKKNDTFAVNKIPLLGDIPILGSVFRKRVGAVSDTDLMIFVTPTIVQETVFTAKQQDRLQLFDEETKDWADQFDQVKKKKALAKKKTSQVLNKEEGPSAENKADAYFYLRPPLLGRIK